MSLRPFVIFLITWAAVAFDIKGAWGITCLSCDRVNHVTDCATIQTCTGNQSCYTARLMSETGDVFYRQGCIFPSSCTNTTLRAGDSLVGRREINSLDCIECCTDEFCNRNECVPEIKTTTPIAKPMATWNEWSHWTRCDVTCGKGRSIRIRSCKDHTTTACVGQDTEQRPCSGANCCFDLYPECSQTEFLVPTCKSQNAASFCQKSCDLCVIDGGWSQWNAWSGCSATCGDGLQMSVRQCNSPVPKNGGDNCNSGVGHRERHCHKNCSVDSGWSTWTPWTPCDVTCGDGNILRARTCTNPLPSNGGAICAGKNSETHACTAHSCPSTHHATVPSTTVLHLSQAPTLGLLTCTDAPECSDPVFAKVACADLYIGSSYCPRLCHICGPTQVTPVCEDKAGDQCKDPTFQSLVCTDPSARSFCERSCKVCH